MKKIFFIILLVQLLLLPNAYGHGFGDRADLPVPPYLYWFGGGTAVIASFVVISLFVGRNSIRSDYGRYNLLKHSWIERISSSRLFINLVRLPPVAILFLVIATGLFGTQFPDLNFAPTLIWIIWWVGFGFLHTLVGNIWEIINPWKTIFEWLRIGRWGTTFEYPRMLGVWPAFVLFFIFIWIELVFPSSADPRSLALLTIGYSIIALSGMYLFGKNTWLRYGEPFSVFFRFVAMLAPTEVRVKDTGLCKECELDCKPIDGWCINCSACREEGSKKEINLRHFTTGLLNSEGIGFDQAAFVILMLTSVSFDGLINTLLWYDVIGMDPFAGGDRQALVQINTMGLVASFLLFLGIFYSFIYLAKSASRYTGSVKHLSLLFVLSLLPIAVVYQFAHYSTFFFINGQQIIKLISDPFGYQWNIFGTKDYVIFRSLNFLAVWNYQVLVIVLGHIGAVYVAHRISLRTFESKKKAISSQYPIMILMVTYTIVGLWLLSTPSLG